MDPQSFYQRGVQAVRQGKIAEGHQLLRQALQQDPHNDMAWVWIARTVKNPDKQRQLLERALALNPDNAQARQGLARLESASQPQPAAQAKPPPPPQRSPAESVSLLQRKQQRQIEQLLKEAEDFLTFEDINSALNRWERVLAIEPDHPEALPKAVQTLMDNHEGLYARRLVEEAVEAGTQRPAVLLTALDFARQARDENRIDELHERLLHLPQIKPELVEKTLDEVREDSGPERARDLLAGVIERQPDVPRYHVLMGDLLTALDREKEAVAAYERAAQLGIGTQEGRIADAKVAQYVPLVDDSTRGSALLAWREVLGITAFYLLLAWQDARLNLALLGAERWLGVGLSLIGGYLLVTATSSPQQKPLAAWFGGGTPPKPKRDDDIPHPTDPSHSLPIIPMYVRLPMGLLGALMLLVALTLVFSVALGLLVNPVPPQMPSFDEIFGFID